MAGIGAVASVASTVISAAGTIAAGKAQKQQHDFQAAQQEVQAKEQRAVAQQEALEDAREKRFALSTLQNRAAASGLGAADPTVLDLMGEIAQYGTLQEQLTRFGGNANAERSLSAAELSRMRGEAAQASAFASGAASIIGGFGRAFG